MKWRMRACNCLRQSIKKEEEEARAGIEVKSRRTIDEVREVGTTSALRACWHGMQL
jgi:hypothetical protein